MPLSLSVGRQRRAALRGGALLCVAALALLSAAVCAAPPAPPRPDKEAFRFGEVDLELLDQVNALDKKFEESGLVYRDAALTAYVEQVGQSLLPKEAAPENVTWKFRVFRDPTVNAFALANGSIYVHTGMLALFENESQLAAVLAHEVVHVRNRHQYLAYRSNRKKAVAAHVFGAIGGYTGMGGAFASLAAQFVLSLTVSGYSRELEKEADLEGAQALLASTYDPDEMAGAFRRLQKKFDVDLDRHILESLYGSHPKLKDREEYVAAAVKAAPQRRTPTAEELAALKERYLKNCEEATRHDVRLAAEQGMYRTALAHGRKLVDSRADSAENVVALADAYAALGPRAPEPTPEELTGKGKGDARKMRSKLMLDEEEKALVAKPAGQEWQKKNFAEAEKLYRRAMELDAKNALAYRGLGALMEKAQSAQAAIDAYRRYVELRPDAMDRLLVMRRIKLLEAKLGAAGQPASPQ
jgi:beta-barrel assembly-enhancing protease